MKRRARGSSPGGGVLLTVHSRPRRSAKVVAAHPDVELAIPFSIEGVQAFEKSLQQLAGSKFEIGLAVCAVYIFLQAFSIPGSFVMNLLSGVVFGSVVGVPLLAVLTTVGSMICYVLSWTFGKPLLEQLGLMDKLNSFRNRIRRADSEGTLFFYLMTVRAFPMSPHWFLNLASPWVGVSPMNFAPTILIGKMPYVWAIVTAGELVSQLRPGASIITWQDQLKLAGLALLLSAPALLMRLCSKKKVASPWEIIFGDDADAEADAAAADDAAAVADAGKPKAE